MDRVEKILVFVVVATIVVIVTIALSNPGASPDEASPEEAKLRPEDPAVAPPPVVEPQAAKNETTRRAGPGTAPEGKAEVAATDPAGRPPSTAAEGPAVPGPITKPAPLPLRIHVVQQNESFWKIAKRYYGDGKYWTVIRDANKDVDPEHLMPETALVIPPLEKVAMARKAPVLRVPPGAGYRIYTLKKGEYLYAVLRRFRMEKRFKEVMKLNGLTEDEARNLKEGYALKIPGP